MTSSVKSRLACGFAIGFLPRIWPAICFTHNLEVKRLGTKDSYV